MAEVIDATDRTKDTAPDVPEVAPSKAGSVLDQIRSQAADARTNLWFDTPLPDTVPGRLGLRLGIPTDARESALDESPSLDNCLADIAANIVGIVDLETAKGVSGDVIDGLTVVAVSEAFAEQLLGEHRPIGSNVEAVQWLFMRGTPATVNAQAVRSTALAYRRWSLDPTPPRSSDQPRGR